MSYENIVVQRILDNLAEVERAPIIGASVCLPDKKENYNIHSNIEIQDGVYTGILIHLIIRVPKDFPSKPPTINIAPGLKFGQKHHRHILEDEINGNQVDMYLLNDSPGSSDCTSTLNSTVKYEWSSSYTLLSVLKHLQGFFANPDLSKDMLPSEFDLMTLREQLNKFSTAVKFRKNPGSTPLHIEHSYNSPYPRLTYTKQDSFKKPSRAPLGVLEIQKSRIGVNQQRLEEKKTETQDINPESNKSLMGKENISYYDSLVKNQVDPLLIQKEVAQKLTCSNTRVDLFDASKPILGYPFYLTKDKFGRLWPTLVVEVLSYQSYTSNSLKSFESFDDYQKLRFRSKLGSQYNYWLPIYIDNTHFERSKQHILNAIAVIYSSTIYLKQEFKPAMVLKVLPPFLVKTVVNFLNNTIPQTTACFDSYFQLYRLFAKLVEIFPELQKAIDDEVQNFCLHEENRHKKVAGDLGEFIIKLSLSSKGLTHSDAKKILFKEHLSRQIFWAAKEEPMLNLKRKCPNFLLKFMNASKISSQFLLVNLEVAKLLLDKDSKSILDKRFGILDKETMGIFQERLRYFQKEAARDWRVLIRSFELEEEINDDEVMIGYLIDAFDVAAKKGYLR